MNFQIAHLASPLPPRAPLGPAAERRLSPDVWRPARSLTPLRAGEVHLWRARLSEAASLLPTRAPLCAEEWLGALRHRCERERARHLAACAVRRSILARYLAAEPSELQFERDADGRPALPDTLLRFHLSHSGDALLLALAYGREVGVDVEETHAHIPCEMLADHYLAPENARSLRLLPPADRSRRFFDLWTAAEAQRHAQAERSAVVTVQPEPGYAGALAVGGGEFRLECWAWQK